jgi:PAS domain S-box-containing protein
VNLRSPADDLQPAPRLFEGPFAQVISASQEAIVLVDEDQSIVGFNPAAEKLFACAAAEALGQTLSRFVPERVRAAHEHHVRRFARSQEMQRQLATGRRIAALRADGSEIPVEVTLSRVDMIVEGRTRHWYAAQLRDLSTEQALRHEVDVMTRRLYTALDATPVAVWIVQDERIAYANLAAAQLLAVPDPGALCGMALAAVLPAPTVQMLREQLRRANAVARVPGHLVRSDGQRREIDIVVAPLPDHGHSVLQMVLDDVTERSQAAAELARSGERMRRLQGSVVEAREDERRRIARELHDELGQRLTALKMEITGLGKRAGLGDDDQRLAGMLAMLDETVAAVRRIASDLRPLMLDDLGLVAAIEWLARDMARRSGMQIQVQLDEPRPAAGERLATALYRMVQEALTNVVRHAHANHVDIELRQRGEWLVLTVTDDGVGLPDPAAVRDDAYGLMGMRVRAAMLGGTVQLDNSGRRGGARLCIQLPLVTPTEAAS